MRVEGSLDAAAVGTQFCGGAVDEGGGDGAAGGGDGRAVVASGDLGGGSGTVERTRLALPFVPLL